MTTTFYKNINVTIPYSYMKYVVGKNGSNLKKCKALFAMDSVWFNTKRNLIEIYGNKNSLDSAGVYIETIMNNVKTFKVPRHEQIEHACDQKDKYVEGSLVDALDKKLVKYLIGKKGYNFKKITKECDVSFIWYNEDKHCICIWGPESSIEKTISHLCVLMNEVKNKYEAANNVDDMVTD